MRKFCFLPAALLAALVSSPLTAQQSGAEAAVTLNRMMSRYAVTDAPGCTAGVSIARDTLTYGFGLAELEAAVPVSPSTIFEAGSVSKQVTAAAIVLLSLDGKLSLGDDVHKYIPELPQYASRITIRNLLNHTSGLRDWGNVAALSGWPRGSRVYNNRIVVDIASHQQNLNYTPGEHYSYTNTGYNLLAVIVARVTGMSFSQFTREHIFVPLGMTSSSWRDDYTRVVPGRATAYARVQGEWHLDMPFDNAHGNGGMLTTVQDLLRFTHGLETGAVAGSAGASSFIQEMHRQGVLNSGRTIPYASGLIVTSWRGLKEVNHSGSTAGYRAFLTRLPDKAIAVAVLCNSAAVNPTSLARQILDSIAVPLAAGPATASASASITAPRTAAARSDSTARSLAGAYRNARAGQLALVSVRAGGVAVGNSPVFSAATDGALLNATGGRLVPITREAGADRQGFYVIDAGDSTLYEPVDTSRVRPEELAQYAGTFISDEADGIFTVLVRDSVLVRRDRYGVVQPLRPAYRDSFLAGSSVISFVRGVDGRVVGLNARSDRAWAVWFRKVVR